MIKIRDASNFDGNVDFTGLAGFTHKATEGIHTVHDQYGPRLAAAKAAGVPVLGSYHVVRTPNSTNGTLDEQLKFWLSYMDRETPWWRDWPHWVMQIDAEKWPYDNVSAQTVKDFAGRVVGSGLPGWKITYASRGQYGDSLAGIATPLWNADYRGSVNGSYPGDGWASGWAPYSGKTPVLLQYTSTPYDENAFRGTLSDLLTLTSTGETLTAEDDILAILTNDIDGGSLNAHNVLHWRLRAIQNQDDALLAQTPFGRPATPGLAQIDKKLDLVLEKLDQLAGALGKPVSWPPPPYKVTWTVDTVTNDSANTATV